MRKVVLLLIAALALFWGTADFVQAQEEQDLEMDMFFAPEELALDEVESASMHRQSIFWSPSAITVFTRDDIRAAGIDNLAELLRRVPGFDVYVLKYAYPLVGARALTDYSNNLLLVLIDGREAMIELSGFPFYNGMSIDVEEVERVEVIRGPGSTLYGANAFAGVVNITTVSDKPLSNGEVYLSGGEKGQHRVFGRVGSISRIGDGTLSISARASSHERRSVSDTSQEDLVSRRLHGILSYRINQELDLSLQAGLNTGQGPFYIYIGDIRVTNALDYWFMGKGEIGLGESTRLKTQAYYTRNAGDLTLRGSLRAGDMWIANAPDLYWDSDTADAKIQIDTRLGQDFFLTGGVNVHYATLDGANLILPDDDELRGAAFVHVDWHPIDSLQLTGGMRLDLNTDTQPALSPRAVVVFRPVPKHAFRLGYAQAFRKPSFLENRVHVQIDDYNQAAPEIVDKVGTGLGNENLINEKVHSFEAGWRAHFFEDRLSLGVDLFYNIYQDTIYFVDYVPATMGVPDIPNSVFSNENLHFDIHAVGGEAELAFRPGEEWLVWCNLGIRDVSEADRVDQFAWQRRFELPKEPRLRLNFGGRYLPESGLLFDLALHYVSAYEMHTNNPTDLLAASKEIGALDDNLLMIGRLGYRSTVAGTRSVEFGLTVQAPIGRPFREFPGDPLPAFMLSGGKSDFGGEPFVRVVALYLRGSL